MNAAGSWKIIGSIVLILALVYIGMIALLALFQRTLIYHPDTGNAGDPKQAGLENGRVVNVTTQDGLNLQGWYIGHDQSDAPTLLYFYGNAGHHGWRAQKLEALNEAGFAVLIAGYRGYGGNPGTPHEQGLYHDGQAFYDWLIDQGQVPADKIIFYGESLGGGVATKIAADNKGAGIVLETPFDSLTATASIHYPFVPFVHVLLRDHFPSDQYIKKVDMPALFMIAGKDKVVPPERGRRLYDIAQEPKQLKVFDGAEHSGLDVQAVSRYLIDFKNKYVAK